MNFKEVVNLIHEVEQRPYYKFERIVITLLEKHFEEKNKIFGTNLRIPTDNLQFDGFIPDGIFSQNTSTIVEIKFFRYRKKWLTSLRHFLFNVAKQTKNIQSTHDFLIVISEEITAKEKENALKNLDEEYPHFRVTIWDLTHLTPVFNKYAEYVSALVPKMEEKAIKNIVEKSLQLKDWKKERKKLIERLVDAYKNDDLTLFLGAGVSASAGMPNWNSLLSRLLVSLISKNLPNSIEVTDSEKYTLANVLQQLNISSPLLEARYVNSGLGEGFEQEVSSVLYDGISTATSSRLIKSIANLCVPPRGALGVNAVVTYNFDDLIETELDNIGLKYRSIFRDADIPSDKELGLFHVHGFLPRRTNLYDGISESLLVFSEKNYHVVMQDPYYWSNLIQLNFFREKTCLLIGLSGTDPNLRRILEIAKKKTKISRHYILLKRTSNEFFIEKYKEQNISYKENLIESINEIHHNLLERSFDEIGLNIIWYEDHDQELPDIINLINEKK